MALNLKKAKPFAGKESPDEEQAEGKPTMGEKPAKVKGKAALNKIAYVMDEFHKGNLHSGSKEGPKVTNPKQGIAIALNQGREKMKGKK